MVEATAALDLESKIQINTLPQIYPAADDLTHVSCLLSPLFSFSIYVISVGAGGAAGIGVGVVFY